MMPATAHLPVTELTKALAYLRMVRESAIGLWNDEDGVEIMDALVADGLATVRRNLLTKSYSPTAVTAETLANAWAIAGAN